MSKLRLKRWVRSIENLSLIQLAGLASLYNGITYIFGLLVLFGVFHPLTDPGIAITERLAFIIHHKDWYQSWIMVIYVSFGSALVVLVLGLHERLSKDGISFLTVGTAFGLIWATLVIASGMIASVGLDTVRPLFEQQPQQASLVWLSVEAIHNGIGGGMEVVGGIWVVLISGAALKQRVFSPWLNYLGMFTGNVGLLTAIPALGLLGALFALLQIVWFTWLGFVLLCEPIYARAQEASTARLTQKPPLEIHR